MVVINGTILSMYCNCKHKFTKIYYFVKYLFKSNINILMLEDRLYFLILTIIVNMLQKEFVALKAL